MINLIKKTPIFFKHLFVWSGSTFVETISKSVVIAIAISILSKEDFGYLSIGMLLVSYLGFLQFGSTDYLMVKLPSLYVNKKFNEIKKSTSYAMTIVLIGITLFMSILIISLFFIDTSLPLSITLVSFTFTSIVYQIYIHYITINRYNYKINIVAAARFINAFIRLFIQLPALYFFSFYGFIFIESILFISSILFMYIFGIEGLKLSIDITKMKQLIIDGVPLFLSGVFAFLFTTLDRWIAVSLFGIEGIATYSVAAFIGTIILFVPGQALSLFSQYIRSYYSKFTNIDFINEVMSIFSSINIIIFGLLMIIIQSLAPFFIYNYLEKYYDVINLIPITLCLIMIRIQISILSNFFIIIQKPYIMLKSNIIAIVSMILINLLFYLISSRGLFYIALATYIAILIQYIYLFIHNQKNTRGDN